MEENILYLCIHKRINEKVSMFHDEITEKDFLTLLGKEYHIPKKLKLVVIKGMEEEGMIEVLGKIGKRRIKIIPMQVNFEKEEDRIYKKIMFL